MRGKPIYENCDQYTAFPSADDVFSSDFEKENLLPLGILNLDIEGVKHEILIAGPIGDEEGLVGKKNIGEHCGYEWVSYSKKNGKWALDCQSDELRSFDAGRSSALNFYQKSKHIFDNRKYLPVKNSEDEKYPLIVLGGELTSNGNWYFGIKDHVSHVFKGALDERGLRGNLVTLTNVDGHEYTYVGNVKASLTAVPVEWMFFYDPNARRVLVICEFY